MRENLRRVEHRADADHRARRAFGRALRCFLLLSLLLGGAQALADDDAGPRTAFILEGGLAVPFGEYGDDYVGWSIPVRIGVDFRLTEHFWVEPFASLGVIRPISVQGFKSLSGFRILAGAAAELHSTTDPLQLLDVYGGLDVAFERVVSHGLIAGCNGCLPSDTVTVANGLLLGLRVGVLFKATPDVRIGPYLGGQMSWMPGLTPLLTVHQPNGQVITTPVDLGHIHFWAEAGIRAAIAF